MLELSVATMQDTNVITIAGEVDGITAPRAQEQILALAVPKAKVILDMTGVTYMSSAGLRLLLLAYRTLNAGGGKILLVGLSDDLKDTMSMTGFLDFFSCCETLDAGLTAMA